MSEIGCDGNSKLRILLIAYEFPPSPSPQSLRWAYLSGRLAALGHEVHVMAPDLGGEGHGLPDPGAGVRLHRVHPGPLRGLLAWLERRRPLRSRRVGGVELGESLVRAESADPPRLNWKGRLLESVQRLASWCIFPDLRGEWRFPAQRVLPALLDGLHPDVVITSHEPATTLLLGLEAKARGLCWIADLGDPVLAPYTPWQWRGRAYALERRTLHEADHVLVTTAETREMLRQRHRSTTPISVVPQGFDDRFPSLPEAIRSAGSERPLELLYAGSFYVFRDPRALVAGVLAVEGVRLNIASGNVPDWLFPLAAANSGKLRLLGRVPHRSLLALQRRADVLVNIANSDPTQIPGKVYEYLGACRPILHVQAHVHDSVGSLMTQLCRGVSCPGEKDAIAKVVSRLADLAREGRLNQAFDLSHRPVGQWGWTELAASVERALRSACGRDKLAV